MSTRIALERNVFDAAVDRMVELYGRGDRVVVSISGGKDSTVCLEICLLAATMTGKLPVEAICRDEEVMFPGTYEYLDRVWQRPDVELHHLVANQPIINAFNRRSPYWWVFDPLVPELWVRQPPPYAEYITDLAIEAMNTQERFPVVEGQQRFSVVGLRVQESTGRLYGLHSSGGYLTKPHARTGTRLARPIYDWTDGDVWRAIQLYGWDYNEAYDVMHRQGIPRQKLRLAPPSMSANGSEYLKLAAQAWPSWWDRVCDRLPGMSEAARFGRKVLTPTRRRGESWEQTFQRECIDNAPQWIADRAELARTRLLKTHRRHSSAPLPESVPCITCQGGRVGSWRTLTNALYLGDPFAMKIGFLPIVEPEFFRAGAGKWGGSPVHA